MEIKRFVECLSFTERRSWTEEHHQKWETLPADYSDRQQATLALEKVLAGYIKHGRNDEQGYWWAIDNEGRQLKFKISGTPN
jgi:hypothetical protein